MKRNIAATSTSVPRKLTATGTAGEKGQLFTVYERNWLCKSCSQENYPIRVRCSRCRLKRPESSGHDYVQDPALLALQAGETHSWKETIDPASKQIYYYNEESRVTQWERPIEMGEAPSATGWFGRGQTGSNAAKKYIEDNTRFLTRPARKQKEQMDPGKYHTEGQNEYNIWYDRYVGDIKDNSSLREAAEDRCVVTRDAGQTKADKGGPSRREKRHFCLHFARGICAKGENCTYYHRIPLPVDDANCDEMTDCFGRQRHSSHRSDMNGVGSFMNPSRTLFVGNLTRSKYVPKTLEEAMWKHFSEWGEVENINVIHRLSIAFPRYRLRTSAEFAKEAMTCQALDCKEILSIRWAKDDPNPIAQNSISMADKDALAAFLDARGVSTKESNFIGASDLDVPYLKKAKVNDIDISIEHPELAYPNTDAQYASSSGVSVTVSQALPVLTSVVPVVGSEADRNYAHFLSSLGDTNYPTQGLLSTYLMNTTDTINATDSSLQLLQDALKKKELLSSLGLEGYEDAEQGEVHQIHPTAEAQSAVMTDSVENAAEVDAVVDGKDSEDDDEGEGEGEDKWTAHMDPDTGATYYHNSRTGQSSWGEAPSLPDAQQST